ncbi:hypothetical protein Drorol1_Dr00000751 [Drosera rotundifolia]
MKKALFACFVPSDLQDEPLMPSCKVANNLASLVLPTLSIDLEELKSSLQEKSISLQWCGEAMLLVNKLHHHFLSLCKSSQAASLVLDHVNTVEDEYMRESLNLLDFCILLKSYISDVDSRRLMFDFAVKKFHDEGSSLEKVEMRRLLRADAKCSQFTRRKNKIITVCKAKQNASSSMRVISSTMSTVSMLILCSIVHPMPRDEILGEIQRELLSFSCFSAFLQELVSSFYETANVVTRTGKMDLSEKEIIGFEIQITEGGELKKQKILQMLGKRTAALREGLDLLESVLNEVFEDVVKGRKQVLELISCRNYKNFNF